jgi:hypothetical protein
MGQKPAKLIDAEAEAIKLKASAEAADRATEAAARANAMQVEAAARASATQTEAAARASATQTEAAARAHAIDAATFADNVRKYAPLVVAGAAGALLCVDFLVHDAHAMQRWRMLRKLRALELPLTASAAPRVPLPTGVSGLRLGPKPTMLLGETGSGKSMRLAQTARDALMPPEGSAAPPTPAAYIRMRQPKTGAGGGGNGGSSLATGGNGTGDIAQEAVASARLEATARLVFEQLGYPSRPSVLSMFWARLWHFKWQEMEWQLCRGQVQRDRFVDALRMLFDAADRLYNERKANGIPEEHAPIVLLFDEVQDLIKDYRLADVGGRFVFEELAVLLVAYGVDRRSVRAAVAGSSAQLAVEFNKTVANGPRWRYVWMRDPSPDTIVAALVAKHYTPAQAKSMIDLVGTRLRLLEAPLEDGAAACSCSEFLTSARDDCVGSFTDLLDEPSVPCEAKSALVDILHRIVAHEAGRSEAPTWHEMPESLRAQQFSKVLFVRHDRTLTFQSQLHRNVWRELSTRYVRQLR